MAYTPHNFFEPPRDKAFPTPDSHQDEAAALRRADRSPVSAFVSVGLALAGLGLLYLGRSLLLPALCLAAVAIVVSVLAWRTASRGRRPSGVAIAALALALLTLAVVILLWL